MNDFTIVTAASSNHFRCLTHLLYSISLFEPTTPVIIYDLGLKAIETKKLNNTACDLRRFAFESYPPHLNIAVERGQYAWKPVLIAEVLNEIRGSLLWLDAGNLIHAKLKKVRQTLADRGFYSPTSSGTIADWTHPETLKHLDVAPEILGKRNRNAAIVGFNANHDGIKHMAERWKECALDINCIAPRGSNRSNHRQDQAVLSVLAYQFQKQYGFFLEDSKLEISTHNDNVIPEAIDLRIFHGNATCIAPGKASGL